MYVSVFCSYYVVEIIVLTMHVVAWLLYFTVNSQKKMKKSQASRTSNVAKQQIDLLRLIRVMYN
jgi:hypothetical protein